LNYLSKIASAAGVIAAPWAYLAGRVLSSPKLGQAALTADPQYLRALTVIGRANTVRHSGQYCLAALLSHEATSDAAERIKRLISVSESQILQDIFCAILLDEKQNGFFVEVGVGGGRILSNTFMLEKEFGWKGLLIEPNHSSHDSIAACRSATLERRAGASQSGLKLQFQEMVNAGEHSRIVGTGGHSMPGAKTAQYEVETVTLNEVLDGMDAPTEIDFLSLDTEGSEVDILGGLDLQKYKFNVMVIEHNFNQDTQNALERILKPFGYKLVLPQISGFEAWYVHESVKSVGFPRLLDSN